jgi:uncharacterized DUF497 family protein
MGVEWDPEKAAASCEKHGLSFEEASELLHDDGDYLEIFDDAGHDEDRFIAIGPIARGVIVVVYTERVDDLLRIISARMAPPRETELFRDYRDSGHG